MELPLKYLRQRSDRTFLLGYNNNEAIDLIEKLLAQLAQHPTPLKIIIAESDPGKFLVYFIAAVSANCQAFLCNPNWGQTEWQQVFNLVRPDLILGNLEESIIKNSSTLPPFPLSPLSLSPQY